MKRIIFAVLISFTFINASAQTQTQSSGWAMFVNNTKFSEKWGMQFDLQLRSADDWSYLRNILIRPGITYFINKQNNITLGYLFQNTAFRPIDAADYNLQENRIFEQYIYTHKIKSIFASHRVRLEQRFIERNANSDLFSQRFRYFFRLIQPLQKSRPNFVNGPFLALQNEIFINIQNKDQINKSVFDQNRLYLAAGYRFSKQLDLEAGYLNQAIHGTNNNTVNNIVQLAVYTRF